MTVLEASLIVNQITAMVITYNEAENLERCLDRLGWAQCIVMVDSGSTDETLQIAGRYPRVNVVQRAFDDFASQCNFGLSQIVTPWVLSLDADYQLSDILVAELPELKPDPNVGGYKAHFIYKIYGRPLHGTMYPPRTVLYRKEGARYRSDGHSHRVSVAGIVLPLASPIYHDDRKPLRRWFSSQLIYAEVEAKHLLSADRTELSRIDRARLLAGPAPFLALVYTLVVKRCLLDGRVGWFYALQRMLAEVMIALEILERRLHQKSSDRS